MKSKHFACFLLILIISITNFTGCRNNLAISITPPPDYYATPEPETEDEDSDIKPLLYKVSDSSGNYIWLLGAVDEVRESFYPLPKYVTSAFENSDVYGVEYDTVVFSASNEAKYNALLQLIYTDDTKITDHISSDIYDKAVEIIDKNVIYKEGYEIYTAVYWSMLLENFTREDTGDITEVDTALTAQAIKDDKEIKELSDYLQFYKTKSQFSPELQELLLEEAIDSYNNQVEAKQERIMIMDAWEKGDKETLIKLLDKEPGNTNHIPLYNEYKKLTYTDKINAFMPQIEESIAQAEVTFYCLDSLLIIGENGIVENLSKKGYTVELVKKA